MQQFSFGYTNNVLFVHFLEVCLLHFCAIVLHLGNKDRTVNIVKAKEKM